MKIHTIIFLTVALLLLQSCYCYQVVNKDGVHAINKKYKIKQSSKLEKVRLIASTDSTITVRNKNNVERTVANKDLKKIKKRYFSYTKTALLPVGVVVVGITAVLAIGGNHFGPNF